MEIKYQEFEADNFFIQKFFGLFLFESYIKYTQEIVKPLLSKNVNKVLIDFRSIEFEKTHFAIPHDFNSTLDKMTEFRKRVNQKELKNKDVQVVMWVDEPLPTLMAHLFISNFSQNNYSHCSTSDEVISALKLPAHFSNLDEIVNSLANTFRD